jgi:hypothetical protein
MATAMFEGAGGRSSPARNVSRCAVARLVAADARRHVNRRGPGRLGLDDAGLAAIGADARALECVGGRLFFF